MTSETDNRSEHTIRRTTKLELGLVAVLVVNVAAVVTFATTMATKVDTVIANMDELRSDIRPLISAEAERAVLRYRVEQIEIRVNAMTRR